MRNSNTSSSKALEGVKDLNRRQFLRAGFGGALIAAVSPTLAGCSERAQTTSGTSSTLQQAASTSVATQPTVDPGALVEAETPFITPSDRFFRIDTADSAPRISVDDWSLRVHGLVDAPFTLRYSDLQNFAATERTVTLACVSNEIGGNLVGTAVWRGVLLADILRQAQPQVGAEQVFTTSSDGWTCGFPLEAAIDNRGALLATSMNGEPLTEEHGFPARLVVPGLYGYVSATKWVTDINLTTWNAESGFWTTRGWSTLAPIKMQSRIDVPRRSVGLDAGPIVIGGVAWAPLSGVQRVQVRVDEGDWLEASLDERGSGATWRQWYYLWNPAPGEYRVAVRVIDSEGNIQTGERAAVDPDGATGWHTRRFTFRRSTERSE